MLKGSVEKHHTKVKSNEKCLGGKVDTRRSSEISIPTPILLHN